MLAIVRVQQTRRNPERAETGRWVYAEEEEEDVDRTKTGESEE